jgi:putative Ig domain-containing protein
VLDANEVVGEGVFPHSQSRAGGPPRLHRLRVASRPLAYPLQQLNGVSGHSRHVRRKQDSSRRRTRTRGMVDLARRARASFNRVLSWCGGVGRVTWTVTKGDLPAGLALHQGGSLTGAPRLAGTYRFTATATDSQRRVASHPLSISVAPSLRLETQRVPAKTKTALTIVVLPTSVRR